MGELVVTGAKLQCPFGTIMTSLCVTSQSKCLVAGKPAATVADVKPNVNIPAFGMCSSPANPQVMATGIPIPKPCTRVPAGTWMTENPKLLAGGKPCLSSNGRLMCAMGAGMITIVSPGQNKVVGK